PCRRHRYEIDGVEVSDFVTPDYYRADAPPGTAFDFLRRLRRPLEVPRGGFLAWQDPADGRWRQRGADGTVATAIPGEPARSPRSERDRAFPDAGRRHELSEARPSPRPGRRWRPPGL